MSGLLYEIHSSLNQGTDGRYHAVASDGKETLRAEADTIEAARAAMDSLNATLQAKHTATGRRRQRNGS